MKEKDILNSIEDILNRLGKTDMDNYDKAKEIYMKVIYDAIEDSYGDGYYDGLETGKRNPDYD